jgi:hypothetical protein
MGEKDLRHGKRILKENPLKGKKGRKDIEKEGEKN